MCVPAVAATILAGVAAKEVVGSLTPDIPKPKGQTSSTPRAIDKSVQAAKTREKDRARGSSSTLLTGGGGLTSTPATGNKTLLGS